jgi:WD40 repeat protein
MDIDTGATFTTFNKHSSQVTRVLKINKLQLITTSADSTIKLWTLSNGTLMCSFNRHAQSVRSVVVIPTGYLVSGGCDGAIKVWDTTNGGILVNTYANAHTGCINDMKYQQSLGVVISVGNDSMAKVWNVTGSNLTLLGSHNVSQGINCVVFLKNGNIVTGSNRIDMWTQAFQLQTGAGVLPSDSAVSILSMTVLADGLSIACGMSDGKIQIFDSVAKTFTSTLTGHTSSVNALDLIVMPNNKISLISGSDDMHVNVYDLTSGNALVKRISMGSEVKSLYFMYNETETGTGLFAFISILFVNHL